MAYRFGREAALKGLVVVSGYARGVDRQAHKGALDIGGNTIAVLSEGLDHFRLVNELKPAIRLEENFLAVSMFEPSAVWKSWRAMERNKLIVALSVGLFVVEARETGGTINAGMRCVEQKKPAVGSGLLRATARATRKSFIATGRCNSAAEVQRSETSNGGRCLRNRRGSQATRFRLGVS